MLNERGLSRAEVLATLYNASRPLGMGFLHYDTKPMTVEQAQALLEQHPGGPSGRVYFDYLQGRVMKLDLGKEQIDPWLYDRDNGQGAAQRAIDFYAEGKTKEIEVAHKIGVAEAAGQAREAMNQETKPRWYAPSSGLADVKNELELRVQEAVASTTKE